MVILKSIVGGVIGFIIGGLLSLVLLLVGVDEAIYNRGVFLIFEFVGAVVGFARPIMGELNRKRRQAEEYRRKQQAEEEARRKQREAEAYQQHQQLQQLICSVRQYCSEAQDAALSLPTILAAAELDLDRADSEFTEGLYSPFWEAIEDATVKLKSFDQKLRLIARCKALHQQKSVTLAELAPPFPLASAVFPEPASTYDRLRQMYRRAQKKSEFANIYEQRRISAKIDKTNAILIAGFRSIDDAIQRIGDQLCDAMQDLRTHLDFRLGDIKTSLESAAEAAAEQHKGLLAELHKSHDIETYILNQLRLDADNRYEHERAARKMLDNIQRRRKPPAVSP